jgi:hypothetical protein
MIILCALIALAGCNAGSDETPARGIASPTPFQPDAASDSIYAGSAPTPLSLPTFTPIPTPTTDLTLPQPTAVLLSPAINPLTGLPAPDTSLMRRRPLAIKVANYPRYIRPQSGLTLADQVFEYYIEDGLTRFTAIFYGNDSEWVGPVRSGRFFDENMQRMYQAYLVFKFADKRVLDYFKTTDFANYLVVPTNGECPPFRLMKSRDIEVYNNSYFNMFGWKDCLEKDRKPYDDPPSFRSGLFGINLPATFSLPGTIIRTYYSVDDYHYWEYVPETGEYIRYQEIGDMREGHEEKYALMVDQVNGQAIAAANVVVLFAYHTFSNPYDEDDEVYHIDLTSMGEAYIFRDGFGFIAKWTRTYANQPLTLTDQSGIPIQLKPGVTFYEVIGTNSFVDQGDGEWTFRHSTP